DAQRVEGLASTGYAVRRFKPGDDASANPQRLRSDSRKVRYLPGYHTPGPDVPEPVPGVVGWVGGIESLSIDGRRYFFGFCSSERRVMSPLIADKRVMAEFAAAYMKQTTNVPHGVDYWLQNVETAVAHSDLCDDAARTLTSVQLGAFTAALERMQSQNVSS